jgi:hypothetical protein
MPHLAIAEEQLARFCRKQSIRRLSLFGSMLAGTSPGPSAMEKLVAPVIALANWVTALAS